MILSFALSVLLSLAAMVFALENAVAVSVRFLAWRFEGSLAVVLAAAFGLGLLAAALALGPTLLRAKWRARSLDRRLRRLEAGPVREDFPSNEE